MGEITIGERDVSDMSDAELIAWMGERELGS